MKLIRIHLFISFKFMRLVLKHRQNTFSFKSTTLTTSHPIHGHTDCPQFKKKKRKKSTISKV